MHNPDAPQDPQPLQLTPVIDDAQAADVKTYVQLAYRILERLRQSSRPPP